jgi:hypothetical protein
MGRGRTVPAAERQARERSLAARRGSRAYKLLLQAGAGAAALASIVGLVVTFVHLRSSGSHEQLVFQLGVPSVTPMTYKDFLLADVKLKGDPTQGVPAADLRTTGVAVRWSATFKDAHPHRSFPTKLTLWERRDGIAKQIDTFDGSPLKPASSDSCGCSEFMPVPRRRGRFYVEVAVYGEGNQALDKKPSRLFSGLG